MLDALMELGDIANLFCTTFIMFMASVLVRLDVLTAKGAYHSQLSGGYVDSLWYFLEQEYKKTVLDDFPACTAHLIDQHSENGRRAYPCYGRFLTSKTWLL